MSFVGELDEFSFYQEIADSEGIVMVFFSGPHCASCHHLKSLLNTEHQQFTTHYEKLNTRFKAYEIKADKAAALVNERAVTDWINIGKNIQISIGSEEGVSVPRHNLRLNRGFGHVGFSIKGWISRRRIE